MSHSSAGSHDLELFSRTVREAEEARPYFAERQWDFDAIEYACLERHAARQPGRFPESLGPDYPKRGETLLLTWSRRLEEAGQREAAKVCVEVLYKLDPRSTVAHDRLAQLAYRRGDLDRAAELLAGWEGLEPANPWPLVRRAIVDQERGRPGPRAEAIEAALQRTHGAVRASVAYLGARLALRQSRVQEADSSAEKESAEKLLMIALQDEPGHVGALGCLAAIRAATGRFGDLAELSSRMVRPQVADARFQLLASACHLAAGDYAAALQAAQRVLADGAFAAEAQFVIGLTHLQRGDSVSASAAFREVATAPQSSALDDSRARLGQISFRRDEYDEAIAWWSALDPDRRRQLLLDRPLQALLFLVGIQALHKGEHQEAARRLVEARRLGCDDPRLESLMPVALLKAGQQLLFENAVPDGYARSLDPSSNGRAHGAHTDGSRLGAVPPQTVGS
jgi:tetratricopeptide (TPR) repeat protein